MEFDEEKILIWEKVHTIDAQCHCMDKISKANWINTNQTLDEVLDQKISKFENFTIIIGLHIEKLYSASLLYMENYKGQ